MNAENVAESLLALGSNLPSLIARLHGAERFTAVGALFEGGHINERIATDLLFNPEQVQVYNFATEAELDAFVRADDTITYVYGTFGDGTDVEYDADGGAKGDDPAYPEWETLPTTDTLAAAGWYDETVLPFETTTDSTETIYETAEAVYAEDPTMTTIIGATLGLAGLDWPRGSGNYHGGKALSEMSPRDLANSLEGVRALKDFIVMTRETTNS